MSTRSTIYYDAENKFHIYQELIENGDVYIEIWRGGVNIGFRLMSWSDWIAAGFPTRLKSVEHTAAARKGEK